MELQFQNKEMPCLRQLSNQVLNQEQTLEVRLDDSKPEVGRVLGAWGQPVLRGKEWHSSGVQVSGGVMAWVLYLPEDGGPCCSVEAWLPFQWKTDIPPAQNDGTVIADCVLRSIDARSLSGKKLMVRANASLQMQVLVPDRATLWEPEGLPEDVQLKQESCQVLLPAEAGEKPFVIDELLQPPADFQKLLRYSLQPELSEQKIMADKVVFRGVGLAHILYLGDDDRVHAWNPEMPFAQYAPLGGQYGEDADGQIRLAVTSLDLTPVENGGLHLNAGLTGQYLIVEPRQLQLVTDAYSTQMLARPHFEELELPVVQGLDRQKLSCQMNLEIKAKSIVDGVFLPECPMCSVTDTGVCLEMAGVCQILYYNEEGELAAASGSWSEETEFPMVGDCRIQARVVPNGLVRTSCDGGSVLVQAEAGVDTLGLASQPLRTIGALELTECEREADRPSLILRRAGKESLWDMAKATGSTVDAIMEANSLEGEPAPERFLLIPVS